MRATRLSGLVNAALGYVAEETSGFIDFDAVPEDGASLQVGLKGSEFCWLLFVVAVWDTWLKRRLTVSCCCCPGSCG